MPTKFKLLATTWQHNMRYCLNHLFRAAQNYFAIYIYKPELALQIDYTIPA